MPTITHGEILPLDTVDQVSTSNESAPATLSPSWPFGYMFKSLQADDNNFLPPGPTTVMELRQLGQSMQDPDMQLIPGVPIPTIYTFLGQLIDHDITLEKASDSIRDISKPNLTPISPEEIKSVIVNSRSPDLELDNVYSGAPKKTDGRMILGKVSLPGTLPSGKDVYNDLPRGPRTSCPQTDRMALIGDPRDDENVIIAQLHVAFLRAHNALIERGYSFQAAQTEIRRHYQWIVLDDFLERIADPQIVKSVRFEGPKFFDPANEEFVIPLEFSVAAYRFGHSKVREAYLKYNYRVGDTSLAQLFTFTLFSGDNQKYDTLPGNWVIDWTHFLKADNKDFYSRPIDTTIVEGLFNLKRPGGGDLLPEKNLAIRNLLRGFILKLPTGQAVAKALASTGITPLLPDQILSVATKVSVGKTPHGHPNPIQRDVLKNSKFLLTHTPLWFYILAEAAYYHRGYHLGPVGSTIVAEVLIGVLRLSTDSILAIPSWRPTLGKTPGEFTITDLIRLAGVL